MARYGQKFKDRAVARLLPLESASLSEVSTQLGVSIATLERWRAEALSRPFGQRSWTAAARLEAVITTAALSEEAKNAWCREHGVYPDELARWRTSATQALSDPRKTAPVPSRPAKTASAARHPPLHPGATGNPRRWSGPTRNWAHHAGVTLNPDRQRGPKAEKAAKIEPKAA